MPAPAANKVDIVTWLINVHHPWQEESDDYWSNPSLYPFMREVLHESVHFWQAVGTPYFLRQSFAAFRDYQEVRDRAVRQGAAEGQPVPIDRLELEPRRTYFLNYQRLNQPYGEGQLSGADLIEGLTRYWDVHLCGMRAALERLVDEGKVSRGEIEAAERRLGPFFRPDGLNYTDAALRFVFENESRYEKAYNFTYNHVGREAFILFPVLGFLALSSGSRSVSNFQRWVILYEETRPFPIPPGGHFFDAWDDCFGRAQRWIMEDLREEIHSSLTVYRHYARKLIGWSLGSSLARRFGLMDGHGILDRYLRKYWWLMRTTYPDVAEDDVELRFHPAFCLPGNPKFRRILTRHLHPPVILFSGGQTWLDQENWRDETPELKEQLRYFGGMLGAAMALTGEFPAPSLKVRCPHTGCPWHATRLCWKVDNYPDRPEDCPMPRLYREQMNLALPATPGWSVAQVDRPIAQERAEIVGTEWD
jgi:hypothetical protein